LNPGKAGDGIAGPGFSSLRDEPAITPPTLRIKQVAQVDDPFFMVLGLHHVQISVPVSMENTAIAFYRDVLGLSEIEKPDEVKDRCGVWFQLGNAQLHLSIEDNVNRRSTKAHVAYEVDNLAYWRQRMVENEVTPVDTIPIPGYDRFEARDPFGNRIEFIKCVM
jgi:catechol 2,3-dioxygenase-like lactoylglutathione lyase family enzyme